MTDFTIGDKVTIRPDMAECFGGAVGVRAKRGDVGTVSAIYQHRSLGLLHKVTFRPLAWAELRADEMSRAETGAD